MTKEEKITPKEEPGSSGTVQPDAQQTDAETAEAPAGESAELQALLTDARTKADEHWEQCLRLQAELENLRKRSERDLAQAHKFALEKFAAELLPVRDSLEMGVAAAAEDSASVEPPARGQ